MKKTIASIVTTLSVIVLVAGTLIAFVCSPLSAAIPGLHATTPMVVLSGSMEPAIHVGGIVFVRPADASTVKPGDIITFSTPREGSAGSGSAAVTTHRVISVQRGAEGLAFKTRGDANNAADPWTVPAQSVRGTEVFSLPLLGYVSTFVRSPIGFVLWVVLPALLLIGIEILDLVREIASGRQATAHTIGNPSADEPAAEVPA